MVNSCANGMDVQMRGFSNLLPLCARKLSLASYNAGEMWTEVLSGKENWTPILVVWGIVTRHFASSSYIAIVFI